MLWAEWAEGYAGGLEGARAATGYVKLCREGNGYCADQQPEINAHASSRSLPVFARTAQSHRPQRGHPSLLLDEDLDTFDSDLAPVLLERYQQLQVRHQFAPGDLVTWKPGLCNRRAQAGDSRQW